MGCRGNRLPFPIADLRHRQLVRGLTGLEDLHLVPHSEPVALGTIEPAIGTVIHHSHNIAFPYIAAGQIALIRASVIEAGAVLPA